MNEFQNLIRQATSGDADTANVGDAANSHVASMDGAELGDNLQTAADNARQSGNADLAQQIEAIVARGQFDPDTLKNDAVQLIRENPQVLSHFAPSFAQGIAGRLGL